MKEMAIAITDFMREIEDDITAEIERLRTVRDRLRKRRQEAGVYWGVKPIATSGYSNTRCEEESFEWDTSQ